MARHPVQPLEKDDTGILHFKKNAIVEYLLGAGPSDLHHLAVLSFSDEDREQFAQLIGYGSSSFGDLSFVSDETREAVELPSLLNGLKDLLEYAEVLEQNAENEWGSNRTLDQMEEAGHLAKEIITARKLIAVMENQSGG